MPVFCGFSMNRQRVGRRRGGRDAADFFDHSERISKKELQATRDEVLKAYLSFRKKRAYYTLEASVCKNLNLIFQCRRERIKQAFTFCEDGDIEGLGRDLEKLLLCFPVRISRTQKLVNGFRHRGPLTWSIRKYMFNGPLDILHTHMPELIERALSTANEYLASHKSYYFETRGISDPELRMSVMVELVSALVRLREKSNVGESEGDLEPE